MHKGFVILGLCALLTAACGGGGEAPPAETKTEPAAAPAPAPVPRVFFISPQDGAMVKSPVMFQFGIENFTIAAVPADPVTETRPMTGHHHLGIEQDCLPPGTEIPKGQPSWVHFGMGNSTIDVQFTPGPHKVSLEVGDDLHRTIAGLCQTINFTVIP